MKTINNHYINNWLKKPILANHYQSWLIDRSSLTARLQQRYADFSVKPVNLQYMKPLDDEARVLNIETYQTALTREVVLEGNGKPVVFAHSVLPRASLRGDWSGLSHLGNKPLGAALFANPKVKRTSLTYKKLSCHHPLYQRVAKHEAKLPDSLWARRSMFSLDCASILVTEIFLPQIFNK